MCKNVDQNGRNLLNIKHQQNTITAHCNNSLCGSHQQQRLSTSNFDVSNKSQTPIYPHNTQHQQNYTGYPQAPIDYQCYSSNYQYNNNFTGQNTHPLSCQQPNLASQNCPFSASSSFVHPNQIHSSNQKINMPPAAVNYMTTDNFEGNNNYFYNHQQPTQGVGFQNQYQHLGASDQYVGLKPQSYIHQNQMEAQCLYHQQIQTNVYGQYLQQYQHPIQQNQPPRDRQFPLQQDHDSQNFNSSHTNNQNAVLNEIGLFYCFNSKCRTVKITFKIIFIYRFHFNRKI